MNGTIGIPFPTISSSALTLAFRLIRFVALVGFLLEYTAIIQGRSQADAWMLKRPLWP